MGLEGGERGDAGVLLGEHFGQIDARVSPARLEDEYGVKIRYESVQCNHARWISRTDGKAVDLQWLKDQRIGTVVVDVRDRPVILFAGDWQLNAALRDLPKGYELAETATGVLVRE